MLYLQASACELPPSAKLRYYYTAFFSFNWLAFACLRPPRYAQSSVATTYKYVDPPAAKLLCVPPPLLLLLATASASFEGRKEHIKLDDNGIVGCAAAGSAARRSARCLSKDDSLLELSDDLDAKEN